MISFGPHRRSFNEPGHAHELTFGCYRGYAFLTRDRTCQWLADSIRAACDELQFDLWAFVFMPNHVHLIVHPQSPRYSMAEFLKAVKGPVSRRALAFLREQNLPWLERLNTTRGPKTESHFWQRGGGFDRNVTEPKTLQKMIDYIHLNPVRKGLVERAADWPWSSAGWFLGQPACGLTPDRIPIAWTPGMTE